MLSYLHYNNQETYNCSWHYLIYWFFFYWGSMDIELILFYFTKRVHCSARINEKIQHRFIGIIIFISYARIPPHSSPPSLTTLSRWYNFKLPKLLLLCMLFRTVAFCEFPLKVSSSEMDLAENGFIRQVFVKERGAEVFIKICPSPILWEPFKDSAPPRSCCQLGS